MTPTTLRRALAGALLLLGLGGPSPGAVGSCGGELSTVDAVQFCANRRVAECNRGRARGDAQAAPPTPCADDPATPENEADPTICNWRYCLEQVPSRCSMASWAGCNPPPSQAVAEACLLALTSFDRLAQPTAEIAECNIEIICPSGAGLSEALVEDDASSSDAAATDLETSAPVEVP